jgi:hypothetical protein
MIIYRIDTPSECIIMNLDFDIVLRMLAKSISET